MTRNIVRKILLFLLFIFAVSFIAFMLMDLSPIDPIAAFARDRSIALTQAQKQKLIFEWGLDKPLLTRYIYWIRHLFSGDLGVSNIYLMPVIEVIKIGFTSSILLMLLSWILQFIIGVPLGIIAGSNLCSKKDNIIKTFAIIIGSTPTYWIGILLIIVFSLKLQLLPASMATSAGILEEDVLFTDRLEHIILPAITMALAGSSNLILHTRSKTEEILNSDYVIYAKSKGINKKDILSKYAFRNLIVPAITIQFASFSEIFSGTIIAENVFNYPGLGNLTIEAGIRGDVPLLLGLVLFSSIFVYVGNRISDLLYTLIDPRQRSKNGICK